jgi:hypothetical protein
MFYSQTKAFTYSLLVGAALFLTASTSYAETVSTDAAKILPALQPMEMVIMPRINGSASQGIQTRTPAAAPGQVIVLEAPRGLSLERLRRENSRYPDQDSAGRFIELSTECPPLFGQEQSS